MRWINFEKRAPYDGELIIACTNWCDSVKTELQMFTYRANRPNSRGRILYWAHAPEPPAEAREALRAIAKKTLATSAKYKRRMSETA